MSVRKYLIRPGFDLSCQCAIVPTRLDTSTYVMYNTYKNQTRSWCFKSVKFYNWFHESPPFDHRRLAGCLSMPPTTMSLLHAIINTIRGNWRVFTERRYFLTRTRIYVISIFCILPARYRFTDENTFFIFHVQRLLLIFGHRAIQNIVVDFDCL